MFAILELTLLGSFIIVIFANTHNTTYVREMASSLLSNESWKLINHNFKTESVTTNAVCSLSVPNLIDVLENTPSIFCIPQQNELNNNVLGPKSTRIERIGDVLGNSSFSTRDDEAAEYEGDESSLKSFLKK